MPKKGDTNKTRRVAEEFVIPKCSSKAFVVKKGQVLRVITHERKQAEMDVLVAATSCPDDSIINDYEPKSVKYQTLE